MEASERKLKPVDVVEGAAAAALEQLGVVSKEQREAEKAKQLELLGMKPAEVVERGKTVKVSQLIESKKNHRRAFGDLDGLGESILRHGQMTAIDVVAVNPDTFEIIAGSRRYRAMKKAGIKEAIVNVYAATPEQAAELRVIENLQREDLKPLEEAENFAELEELGYSRKTIAAASKKTVGWVHARLLLLKLTPKAKSLVFDGKLPDSVAYPLGRYPAEQQDRALKQLEEASGVLASDERTYSVTWEQSTTCNARRAIDFLQNEFARSLKSTPFDQTDATLNPEKGACAGCSDNSENQPRLDGEEKGKHAMCFNLPCFKLKSEAAWKRTAAKAEEKGAEVLSVAESKGVLQGIDYRSGSRYVRATAKCDGFAGMPADPKKRTVAQLVAELPEPKEGEKDTRPVLVVAPDETKKPVKLFERADVERAFAAHFSWAKKKVERDTGAASAASSKKAKERQARLERVGIEVLRKVVDATRKKVAIGELRAAALALHDYDLDDELCSTLEPMVEGDGVASLFGMKTRAEVKSWLEKKAKLGDLCAFIYVQACGNDFGNAFGGYSAEVKEAAARHKADLRKLEKLDEEARRDDEDEPAKK